MRGSKPGRCSPAAGLTLVASMSVIVPAPLTVPVLPIEPLGTGWLVSPGSSSGLLRKRSGFVPRPPSTTIGPRTLLTRSSKAGTTSASPPSTMSSSTAATLTVWARFQLADVKTSCEVTTPLASDAGFTPSGAMTTAGFSTAPLV